MSVRCIIDNIVSAFPVIQLTMKAKLDFSYSEDICFASMKKNEIVDLNCHSSNEDFLKETHEFVHNVIEHLVNDTGQSTVNEKVRLVLCVSNEYFERKNGSGIKEAVDLIEFSKETYDGTILRVASKMFQDDELNWGRIVAFLVFSGKLAKKGVLRSPSDAGSIKRQACHSVTSFIISRLAKWIVDKGGWAQFVKDMKNANGNKSDKSAIFRTESSVCDVLITGALSVMPLVFAQLLLNRA